MSKLHPLVKKKILE